LVTPWWSEANTAVALVICFWIITPIIYCMFVPLFCAYRRANRILQSQTLGSPRIYRFRRIRLSTIRDCPMILLK
jgi:hypothetical protein